MSDQLQHQPQKKRQIPLSILALMVIFFLLFCFIFIWGISPVNEKGSISAPVHASTQAVYGVEDNRLIPRISKNIIRDVILDHNPYATAEIAQRMSSLLANLQTPVPEVTLSLKNQAIATSLALTESPAFTSTTFPTASLEPSPFPSPTTLATTVPTVLPTALPPVFIPTSTPIPQQPQPGIQVVKKLASYEDNDSSNSITFGDRLWYEFKVSNTGDTLLSQVSVEDISFSLPVSCPNSKLAAGNSMVCTADTFHSVTAQEVTAGEVTNKALASGDYNGVYYQDTDKLTLPIEQNPAIQVNKSLRSYDDNDSSGGITQDDGLWYQFDVTNAGGVTLTNIGVTDDTFAIPITCPSTVLAPSASMTCLANSSHIVTPAETQAGQVVNAATASGAFNGTTCTDSDTLTTTVIAPGLTSSISGQVRNDVDGDGDFSDADTGIPDVAIELYDGICAVGVDCYSIQTDSEGMFSFADVPAGSYILFEQDPPDYVSTADSVSPNDNQIPVTVSGGVNSSGNVFLDWVDLSVCSDPDPVSGFVLSSSPADGETGVPLSTTTLFVTFSTPMITFGSGSVLDVNNFGSNIANSTLGGNVPILNVLYDSTTKTASLTIDTSDSQWQGGSEFHLQVKSVIRNACGVKQDVTVDIFFTTE